MGPTEELKTQGRTGELSPSTRHVSQPRLWTRKLRESHPRPEPGPTLPSDWCPVSGRLAGIILGAGSPVPSSAAQGSSATDVPRGSLRKKAAQLGPSHETVRQTMISAGEPTDIASRNRAIREMAISGAAWPEIARAFGMSPSGVRFVCRDLPRRKAGRRWHKTTEEKNPWRHGG